MIGLTYRQSEVLAAIKEYIARVGFPPTMTELARLIGCSSPNAAADHVKALRRKGYISSATGAARGIAVVDSGNDLDAISVVKSLLEGGDNAKERAVAWLQLQGVEL
ncbi:MAG: LexA family transcriptional regulator [Silvania sp.]|uniref:LexA family protein n=1 Tax=Silvania sp. TaxID=3016633 RepID=UPI003EE74AB9